MRNKATKTVGGQELKERSVKKISDEARDNPLNADVVNGPKKFTSPRQWKYVYLNICADKIERSAQNTH